MSPYLWISQDSPVLVLFYYQISADQWGRKAPRFLRPEVRGQSTPSRLQVVGVLHIKLIAISSGVGLVRMRPGNVCKTGGQYDRLCCSAVAGLHHVSARGRTSDFWRCCRNCNLPEVAQVVGNTENLLSLQCLHEREA